jgi:hypothetical protein
MATITAMHEREGRHNKFLAALQGVNLEGDQATDSEDPTSLQEIYARVNAKLTGDQSILDAANAGITEDMGLGYMVVGNGRE